MQYDINIKAVKGSALPSRKTGKYKFFTDKEILPSDQSRITEQAKFTYPSLGKAFEKQIKTIEEQGQKQGKALELLKPEENKGENKEKIKPVEGLFPKDMRTNEIKNAIDEIKKWENKIKQKDLKFETNRYIFDFQQIETIRSFGDSIYNGKINIKEAEMKRANLLENFNNKSKPRSKKEKDKKQNTFDSTNALMKDKK